jgi:XRE family transcriptional regulator, regulator of sulfur utilization
MELYEKIVAARKKKGLTQEELAGLTNITARTIQRIESGASTPRAYTLKAIAGALDTSYEDLVATGSNTINDPVQLPGLSKEANGKHFLQMLCLSCFSYLVVPFVHFLIPVYILKRSAEQDPRIIAFARQVIKMQLYWKAVLWFLMLATVAYNISRAVYFEKTSLLNYLLPFFAMYLVNAILITASLLRVKRADFSFAPAV